MLQLALIEPRESLPAATARDCAPHWLKAAGWLAALLSDATAAAMGRLPAAQRPEQPRSHLDDAASGPELCVCICGALSEARRCRRPMRCPTVVPRCCTHTQVHCMQVVVARSRAGSWAVALRLLLAELVRLAHNDTYSRCFAQRQLGWHS